MKFNEIGTLRFRDDAGDALCVHVYDDPDCFFIIETGDLDEDTAVKMTFEEARKFSKAIRKQVKLAEMGDLG